MISKLKKILAIAFSFLMIVSLTYAFTGKNERTKTTNTQFRYTGPSTDYTDLIEPANWEVADEEDEDCPSVGTIPCLVAPDMSSITSPEELVDHLEDYNDEEDAVNFILDNTDDWRN